MDESALRILVSSLEASRSTLHWWLEFWTFLVVAGVALEVVFVVWEYVEELHDSNRGIVHPPERPSRLLFALGLLGAALVATGVAGELYAESKIETVETRIRRANDELFSLLSKEAGDAKTSSGEAKASASAVKNQADDLLRKYEAAERALVALKAERLPRRLSSKQKELLGKRVAEFANKSIFVGCMDDGTETWDFEQDFVKAFSSPALRFKLEYMTSCSVVVAPVMGPQAPSIQVEAGAERQGDEDILVKALMEIGMNKTEIVTRSNPNKSLLALTIGPKPL